MNDHSKPNANDHAAAFKIESIHFENIEPSDMNKYSVADVAELKASIELYGLQQNLLVRLITLANATFVRYEIISGHRRYKALCELIAEGKLEYSQIPCRVIEQTTDIHAELQLIFANATSRRLSDYEITYQAGRIKELLTQLQQSGQKIEGRKRDIVAELLQVSPAQVARMESINKNLSSELTAQFESGSIGITAAYEASRLDSDHQAELLEQYQSGVTITPEMAKREQKRQERLRSQPDRQAPAGGEAAAIPIMSGQLDLLGDEVTASPVPMRNVKSMQKPVQNDKSIFCPFCGRVPRIADYNKDVVCCSVARGGCGARLADMSGHGQAIAMWNTRVWEG